MVQMNYHEAVNNAPQWNAAYCYPEGFMRWWAQFAIGQIEIMATPHQVQFLAGIADNFLRRVLIGRSHVQQVPQWYGETVGFWKGDVLIAWTANVQGWTLSHSMFEFSNSLETVEVFTPRNDADGNFAGLTVETTFYDPEAFVAPLRNAIRWDRTRRAGSSDAALHVHRVPEQHHERQRPPDAAHDRRPRLHRLLRPAMVAELGQAGGGLGKAPARRFPAYWAANSVSA